MFTKAAGQCVVGAGVAAGWWPGVAGQPETPVVPRACAQMEQEL